MEPSHDAAPQEVTQAKPIRRRRRWLILVLLLVLVSMVSWWFWPRGDARFVGSWVLVDNIGGSSGAYRFHGNGLAERYDQSSTKGLIRTATYRWSVNWPELRLQPTGATFAEGAVAELAGAGGQYVRLFKIVNVTDQLIEVIDNGLQRTMTFERVQDPE